jgi:mRNA-degrading endonuclease toxin of MazEF toxin-antitoxin module
MIDKAATVPRRRIGQRIGRLDDATLQRVDTTLARFLGLAV